MFLSDYGDLIIDFYHFFTSNHKNHSNNDNNPEKKSKRLKDNNHQAKGIRIYGHNEKPLSNPVLPKKKRRNSRQRHLCPSRAWESRSFYEVDLLYIYDMMRSDFLYGIVQ